MTTTDPTTGLPEVPEGYFWQIRPAMTAGMYRLELRKKFLWIFSERVCFGLMDYPLSAPVISRKAASVLSDWSHDQHRNSLRNQSKSYIGKYPPKTLKDVSK